MLIGVIEIDSTCADYRPLKVSRIAGCLIDIYLFLKSSCSIESILFVFVHLRCWKSSRQTIRIGKISIEVNRFLNSLFAGRSTFQTAANRRRTWNRKLFFTLLEMIFSTTRSTELDVFLFDDFQRRIFFGRYWFLSIFLLFSDRNEKEEKVSADFSFLLLSKFNEPKNFREKSDRNVRWTKSAERKKLDEDFVAIWRSEKFSRFRNVFRWAANRGFDDSRSNSNLFV